MNLKKNPFRNIEYQKRIQFNLLKNQLVNAYKNSNFYKKIWDDAGFNPDIFLSFNDMNNIPIITKEDLKKADAQDIITTKKIEKLNVHHTSGSTGIPLNVYFSRYDLIRKDFMWLRTYFLAGMKIFSKLLILADPCDIRQQKWFQKLGIFRYKFLNVFDDPKKNFKILKRNDFDILIGYPIDLKMMARMTLDYNAKIAPKVIFSTAEFLDEDTRDLIETAFKAPVCDFYGCTEGGNLAFQVANSKEYFVPTDIVYLEILQGKEILPIEKAHYGEAIITNLWNRTYPVIRYKIGDFLRVDNRIKSHHKRIKFPLISEIIGKYLDFLVFPGNILVSPHKPKQLLTNLSNVKAFQLYQEKIDNIEVRVCLEDNARLKDVEKDINMRLSTIIPKDVSIHIREVPDFNRSASKKFKVIESKVGQKYFNKRGI
jgi:phenylacetate-CoA ligase